VRVEPLGLGHWDTGTLGHSHFNRLRAHHAAASSDPAQCGNEHEHVVACPGVMAEHPSFVRDALFVVLDFHRWTHNATGSANMLQRAKLVGTPESASSSSTPAIRCKCCKSIKIEQHWADEQSTLT
jgi:hypothetical protein